MYIEDRPAVREIRQHNHIWFVVREKYVFVSFRDGEVYFKSWRGLDESDTAVYLNDDPIVSYNPG